MIDPSQMNFKTPKEVQRKATSLGMSDEDYINMVNKSPDEKEQAYQKMGTVNFKKKKIYFSYTQDIALLMGKYFRPILNRVLAEDDENYGGLKAALEKFQDKIFNLLQAHPELGPTGGLKKAQIQRAMQRIINMRPGIKSTHGCYMCSG